MVNIGCLPEKLNPIVKPIMEAIKREECQIIQELAAQYLAKLLDLIRTRNPSPNNKIVTNLCTLLKSDPDFTPRIVCRESTYWQFLMLIYTYHTDIYSVL